MTTNRRLLKEKGIAMRQRSTISGIVLFGVLTLCAATTSALGQSSVSVSLIQQDSSDCTNTTVKDDPDRIRGGDILVTRNSDGTTTAKVGMTVTPGTTYHFYLKCVRQLGDITTDDGGIGLASFAFETSAVGNVYAFDMYPQGAPSGNKFQSLTVTFK